MTASLIGIGMPALSRPPAAAGPHGGEQALPHSFGLKARHCRAAIAQHLRARNEGALLRAVAQAGDTLTAAELPLACWVPCLIGFEAARRSGRPWGCASLIAHHIAVCARAALKQCQIGIHAPWLVGVTVIDQSAAHLIALLLVRSGTSVRPWWAPGMPRRGGYLLVSIGDGARGRGDGPPCLGTMSLALEAWREFQRLEDGGD